MLVCGVVNGFCFLLLRCSKWGSLAFLINFGFLDVLCVLIVDEEMVSSSFFVLME